MVSTEFGPLELHNNRYENNMKTVISYFFTESVMNIKFVKEIKIKSLHLLQITLASNNSRYEVPGKTLKALHSCHKYGSRQDCSLQQLSLSVLYIHTTKKLLHQYHEYRRTDQGLHGIKIIMHPNVVQFLEDLHNHRNTWFLMVETVPLSKWLLNNPSSLLHNEVQILNDDVANNLHSQNLIHHNLVAVSSTSLQAVNTFAAILLKLTDSQDIKFSIFQSFMLNMQQRQCVLPSELINYMHLHSSVRHMISYTGVKQLTENICISAEVTNETGYSQLVVCVDIKAYLVKKINEVETEEPIQEEAFTLSEVCICNQLSQFMENDVYEKNIELAMVVNKFQSPIALLECVIDELKIRIFAKIGNEIKKASFSVPLHNTYCRHHPFNTELCGLWQFINDRNNFFQQELPFSVLYKMIIAPIMQHFNSLGVPKLDQCIDVTARSLTYFFIL